MTQQLDLDQSSFFNIYELVGTIIGILAEQKEGKAIFNIGMVSKKHNEYVHSLKMWKCFHNQALAYDKNDRISTPFVRSIINHTNDLRFALDIYSNNTIKQYNALQKLNQLIRDSESIRDLVSRSELLPYLVRLLESANDNRILQREVIIIFTNIAAGTMEHQQSVIDAGAFKPLLQLFKVDNIDIQGECALALSNTIHRNVKLSNELFESGVLDVIHHILEFSKNNFAALNCMFLCENLGKVSPRMLNLLLPTIPFVVNTLVAPHYEKRTRDQACSFLRELILINLTLPFERLQQTKNALQTIVNLMTTQLSALVVLKEIVFKGSTMHIQEILSAGFMNQAKNILRSQFINVGYVRSVLWILSVMMERNSVFVLEFIKDGEIFLLAKQYVYDYDDTEAQKEAMWVFAKALYVDRSPSTYNYFLNIGVVTLLYHALVEHRGNGRCDLDLIETLLQALQEMLKYERAKVDRSRGYSTAR